MNYNGIGYQIQQNGTKYFGEFKDGVKSGKCII